MESVSVRGIDFSGYNSIHSYSSAKWNKNNAPARKKIQASYYQKHKERLKQVRKKRYQKDKLAKLEKLENMNK